MSTPRKRPGIVATEHLKAADAALATANILQHDARVIRKAAATLFQEKICAAQQRLAATDVKRYPETIELLINKLSGSIADYQLLLAQAAAHDADAATYYEMARRFFVQAQTAYKEE